METSPTKAIRDACLMCCCGSVKEVRLCPTKVCPLKEWRFGKNPYRGKETTEITNPVKVIAHFCKTHCSPDEPVAECTENDCPLFPFRMGKNPFRAERTQAQIESAQKAFEKLQASKNDPKKPTVFERG